MSDERFEFDNADGSAGTADAEDVDGAAVADASAAEWEFGTDATEPPTSRAAFRRVEAAVGSQRRRVLIGLVVVVLVVTGVGLYVTFGNGGATGPTSTAPAATGGGAVAVGSDTVVGGGTMTTGVDAVTTAAGLRTRDTAPDEPDTAVAGTAASESGTSTPTSTTRVPRRGFPAGSPVGTRTNATAATQSAA